MRVEGAIERFKDILTDIASHTYRQYMERSEAYIHDQILVHLCGGAGKITGDIIVPGLTIEGNNVISPALAMIGHKRPISIAR